MLVRYSIYLKIQILIGLRYVSLKSIFQRGFCICYLISRRNIIFGNLQDVFAPSKHWIMSVTDYNLIVLLSNSYYIIFIVTCEIITSILNNTRAFVGYLFLCFHMSCAFNIHLSPLLYTYALLYRSLDLFGLLFILLVRWVT